MSISHQVHDARDTWINVPSLLTWHLFIPLPSLSPTFVPQPASGTEILCKSSLRLVESSLKVRCSESPSTSLPVPFIAYCCTTVPPATSSTALLNHSHFQYFHLTSASSIWWATSIQESAGMVCLSGVDVLIIRISCVPCGDASLISGMNLMFAKYIQVFSRRVGSLRPMHYPTVYIYIAKISQLQSPQIANLRVDSSCWS